MDILAGTPASLRVDFRSPLGSLVADPGSVRFSLFGQTGQALLTDQALSSGSGSTWVSVPISAVQHTISPGRDFEKRSLVVYWTSGSQSYHVVIRYRVIPLVLYSVGPAAVRTFFGYNEDELADDEVDLFEAYLHFKVEFEDGRLDELLVSGSVEEELANEAIMLLAAARLVPSLKIRTPREVTSGTDTFTRFATAPDFDTLIDVVDSRLRDIRSVLGTTILEATVPFVLVLTTPTDAVTGV